MSKTFYDLLKEKTVVFDGATGTHLQSQNLTPDDFGGEHLAGCNEHLVFSKPSAVEAVHRDYLEAGADVVETDSFGGTSIVLAEYDLAARAYDMNKESAAIAKRMAREFSTPAHPRFVAGSMGPTTKLPSLGHITFDAMCAAYREQALGLIDGGADLLIVETCQDVLQIKTALAGIQDAFSERRVKLPVIVSVTIETVGTMLVGTEIGAALTSLEPYDIVDVIGINCATGPKEMSEHIRVLTGSSPKPVFVMPNAGIPENIGGKAHYHLTPEELTSYMTHFVKDLGVNIVGGCCGTTKEHIRMLAEAMGRVQPAARRAEFLPSASSLYSFAPFRIQPPPVLVAERTNANGSKLFRDLLAREDWEGIVAMGKEQVREQAHMLDLCVAYVGRDEKRDMREVMNRFNTQITIPVVIDSTEPPIIEEALKLYGGKAVINSVNLEDGEERCARILPMCKRYGAAVIALTIDETGMAKTAQKKLEVARRLYSIAVNKYGIRPHDLIFDTLTFTLGSGDEEFRAAGRETIEAIRLIKQEMPETQTLLGVSNISFGLSPSVRHAINSVFLHYAVEAGLDMAIVHASKIMPLFKIDERLRQLCKELIFDERRFESQGNDRRCVYDPLTQLMALGTSVQPATTAEKTPAGLTVEERLRNRIIDGNKVSIRVDLDEALKKYSALDIINTILLDGMKVVGDLFGSGQMQLPFVLQSAETMKAAVGYLEQFMEKKEGTHKGTIVLATVKGDVHDIGKNLVDIILTNNGYKVVNLGIKCPVETMLSAAEEHSADAIGMSGLLVKSTLVMKENLEVMNEQNLTMPVIVGGAALTRRYVEGDLRRVYEGPVLYANDAFDGLSLMERIVSGEVRAERVSSSTNVRAGDLEAQLASEAQAVEIATVSSVAQNIPVPVPPFWGAKIVDSIDLDEVYPYINDVALIRGQWRVVKGSLSAKEYDELLEKQIYPELKALQKKAKKEKLLVPKVVYGYFPCHSNGNDLIVYAPENPSVVFTEPLEKIWPHKFPRKVSFTFPRQPSGKRFCISDFFRPLSAGAPDVIAFHVVTMGRKASEYSKMLYDANRYKEYLYFHGLSVESAEALAEYWHKKVREELSIAGEDSPDIRKLFSQHYRGSRYSFGYPACPNLEDQQRLFELLAPSRIDVELSEEFQMHPEQSTSALIAHHPEARYFFIK